MKHIKSFITLAALIAWGGNQGASSQIEGAHGGEI